MPKYSPERAFDHLTKVLVKSGQSAGRLQRHKDFALRVYEAARGDEKTIQKFINRREVTERNNEYKAMLRNLVRNDPALAEFVDAFEEKGIRGQNPLRLGGAKRSVKVPIRGNQSFMAALEAAKRDIPSQLVQSAVELVDLKGVEIRVVQDDNRGAVGNAKFVKNTIGETSVITALPGSKEALDLSVATKSNVGEMSIPYGKPFRSYETTSAKSISTGGSSAKKLLTRFRLKRSLKVHEALALSKLMDLGFGVSFAKGCTNYIPDLVGTVRSVEKFARGIAGLALYTVHNQLVDQEGKRVTTEQLRAATRKGDVRNQFSFKLGRNSGAGAGRAFTMNSAGKAKALPYGFSGQSKGLRAGAPVDSGDVPLRINRKNKLVPASRYKTSTPGQVGLSDISRQQSKAAAKWNTDNWKQMAPGLVQKYKDDSAVAKAVMYLADYVVMYSLSTSGDWREWRGLKFSRRIGGGKRIHTAEGLLNSLRQSLGGMPPDAVQAAVPIVEENGQEYLRHYKEVKDSLGKDARYVFSPQNIAAAVDSIYNGGGGGGGGGREADRSGYTDRESVGSGRYAALREIIGGGDNQYTAEQRAQINRVLQQAQRNQNLYGQNAASGLGFP